MKGNNFLNTIRMLRQTDDGKLSFIISFMIFELSFVNGWALVENSVGISHEIIGMISKIILALMFVFNCNRILKRINYFLFVIAGLVFGAFLVSFLIGINKTDIGTYFFNFFSTVFPMIIVGTTINNYGYFIKQTIYISKLVVFLGSIFVLVSLIDSNVSVDYSMGFSASLCLPIIILFYDYFENKIKSSYILAFIGCCLIIAVGSRGALIGIAMFYLVMMFIKIDELKTQIKRAIFIVILLILIAFYKPILLFISDVLEKFNISSRTLYLLINDPMHDSGRSEIYSKIWDVIKENPFLVRGIAADRFFAGTYSHNIFLELLCEWGVFWGGLAIIYILYLSIYSIFICKKGCIKDTMLLFFCTAIPILMVSNTIWASPYFWLWIVVGLRRKRLVQSNTANSGEIMFFCIGKK